MRIFLAVFALLPLAACSGGIEDRSTPTPAEIARLETRLSGHPCVGKLDEWERNYRFSRKAGLFSYSFNPDFDVIEFHFRRTGTVTIGPGRTVYAPAPGGDWPDSSPIRTLDGRFTLSSDALAIAGCKRRPRS